MSWEGVKGTIGVFVRNYRRALTVFGVIIAVALIYGGYMMYLASVETTSSTKQKRHLAAVEDAREGLRDDEKTPLTSDFLAEEYKIYVKGENRFELMGLVALTVFVYVIFGGLIFVEVRILRSGKPGRDYDIVTLMRLIMCLGGLVFLIVILSKTTFEEIRKKVNPSKPDITVQAVEILKKESGSKEYTNSEGQKRGINYYYLRCEVEGEPKTFEVPFEIFNQMMKSGPYYLAYIEKSTGNDYVGIYSAEEYTWPT